MKKILDIKEELRLIQLSADTSDTGVRTHKDGAVGHQGDVYIHPVPDDHQHGPQTDNMQVALGSTKGARHVVVGDGVKVYAGTTLPSYMMNKRAPMGPMISAPNGFVLTHPSHAHHWYGPGNYQITLQFDLSMMPVLD
jgi:hypothetical protein